MKDILDYPIDTKGSDLPQEILALHVSRCEKTVAAFGGQDEFFEFINTKPCGGWVLDYKAKFEEVNGVKFPNNIRFEL